MKRGGPVHRKTKRLARLLGIPRAHAVGLLECLWHAVAREVPDGGVGVLSDEEIAEEAGWEREAGLLVESMVESGWLDRHPEHRLVVHDWPAHADDAVHMALCRARRLFADGTAPRLSRLGGADRERAERWLLSNPCARRAPAVRTALPSPPLPEEEESSRGGEYEGRGSSRRVPLDSALAAAQRRLEQRRGGRS